MKLFWDKVNYYSGSRDDWGNMMILGSRDNNKNNQLIIDKKMYKDTEL